MLATYFECQRIKKKVDQANSDGVSTEWPHLALPSKTLKVASLSKILLYLFMLTEIPLPSRFRKLLLALCFYSNFKTKVRIMYSIQSNDLFFFLDITMFLKKRYFFYYHCKLHFIKWPVLFLVSNSVSQSSVNLDCSEIDSPDEIIRFEQRSGLYADNGLGLKYFLVPSKKL